jgi:hypothetical protein
VVKTGLTWRHVSQSDWIIAAFMATAALPFLHVIPFHVSVKLRSLFSPVSRVLEFVISVTVA